MAKGYPNNYQMDARLIELVQVTRRAKMDWDEADEFLKANGVNISKSKYDATKRYIHDSISNRIQYIATTEFADVHLQLLDGMKEQLSQLEKRKLEALKDGKDFLYVRLCETEIKTIHAVKELYNSSTIVGGIDKMISDLKKKLANQTPAKTEDEKKSEEIKKLTI